MSQSAFAQAMPGAGASAGKNFSSDRFAWAIGLGMVIVVGTIVGVTVAAATSSQSNASH
ncbi:MAG: hypothetical protein KGQ49_04465 [Verrucomicrobia bacterium]|nr:hypothetical protein [Verrucomicrobiota bacterium]MBU6446631.1 hypothetical protein [Verrucomicrobiota bacterium]MDE3047049.1 hypothetical protein [Verrucomicrobiota bacterium]